MFKIGDKVKCINGTAFLIVNEEYIVKHRGIEKPNGETLIRVEPVKEGIIKATSSYFEKRFVAVEPEAPAIMAAGVKLTVLEGHRPSGLRKGTTVTVRTTYANGTVMLEELPGIRFRQTRFEIKGKKKEVVRELKVGDKVIPIAGTDNPYGWAIEMNEWADEKREITVSGIFPNSIFGGKKHTRIVTEEGSFTWVPANFMFPDGTPVTGGIPIEVEKEPPKPKEPTLPEIIEQMKNAVKEGSNSVCSFAWKVKGEKFHHQINPACYAPFMYQRGELEAFINSMGNAKQRLDDDQYKNYLKWFEYVYKNSPWRDCFIQQDSEVVLRDGVELDVTKTPGQIIGACTALREGHEYYSERIPTFLHFIEQGYGENTAFVMCNLVRLKKDKFVNREIGRNHDVLSGRMNYKELIKFFQQGYHLNVGTPSNKGIAQYKIFASIASISDGKENLNTHYKEHVKQNQVGEGFYKDNVPDTDSVYEYAEQLNKQIN